MAAKQKLTRVNWIYDEIVLVADVLSRNNWKYIEPTSEAALQLSTLLRDGILHGDRVNHPSELPDSFRNTSSIALKSSNIITSLPTYEGKGTHGNRLDTVVAQEFLDDEDAMREYAAQVRAALLNTRERRALKSPLATAPGTSSYPGGRNRTPPERPHNMIVAFSVAPSGTGRKDASVHDAVAAAVQVVRDSGLPNRTTSMFTELEGTWDEVFAVVKAATEAVEPFGSRVSLVLKADIRPGYEGEIDAKVERLEKALGERED